jgi:hypothetical protein
LGPVRFYHFERSSIETWRGDRLIGLISDADDNGEVHHLQAREDGDSLALSVDGQPPVAVAATSVPSSLWRRSMVREDRPVFDMDDGQPLKITPHCDAEPLGTICKITGDLERTLHFGAAGLLIGETLTADDGSEVAYVPR